MSQPFNGARVIRTTQINDGSYIIMVQNRDEYVTGKAHTLADTEWYAGRYFMDFDQAVTDYTARCAGKFDARRPVVSPLVSNADGDIVECQICQESDEDGEDPIAHFKDPAQFGQYIMAHAACGEAYNLEVA